MKGCLGIPLLGDNHNGTINNLLSKQLIHTNFSQQENI